MVKALDLRSNGRMSAWVRTPLLVTDVFLSGAPLRRRAGRGAPAEARPRGTGGRRDAAGGGEGRGAAAERADGGSRHPEPRAGVPALGGRRGQCEPGEAPAAGCTAALTQF